MTAAVPEHEFDDSLASPFSPDPTFFKTAVRFDPAPEDATTRIRTPFGEQTFRGPFYLVAQASGSYGAALVEFEAQHDEVEPNRWVKRESVLAYRVTERCSVTTRIGGHTESEVLAEPGDWFVKQSTGEVMVVSSEEFTHRYRPAGDDDR